MGFEDDSICNTALTLSLLGSSDHDVVAAPGSGCRFHLKSSPPVSDTTCLRPSLTLGGPPPPEEELKFEVAAEEDGTSMASSFSNSSMKREREIGGGGGEEEVELEIMEPTKGLSGDDDEVVGTRKKLRLTKEQSVVLEDSFKEHSTLNSKQKETLARRLNLRPRQVEVWFQNRRARNKLKQTEVDCELLRKCYDSLTDENRRLQRELQELKAKTPAAAAVAVAQPFYMQLSAATPLTMCPSCQRTYGGSGDNSAANIGEKSHYYGSKHNGTIAC